MVQVTKHSALEGMEMIIRVIWFMVPLHLF